MELIDQVYHQQNLVYMATQAGIMEIGSGTTFY
jgi:hypothetical protein